MQTSRTVVRHVKRVYCASYIYGFCTNFCLPEKNTLFCCYDFFLNSCKEAAGSEFYFLDAPGSTDQFLY